MMRRIAIGSLAFLAAGHMVIAETHAIVTPPMLDTYIPKATTEQVFATVEATGTAVGVAAPQDRRITEVWASEGDMVKAGQPIVILESEIERAHWQLAQAQVELEEARVNAAEAELHRAKDLLNNQVISEADFTKARFVREIAQKQLSVAKREADLAAAMLDRMIIKAPVTGTIQKLNVQVGQQMTAGDSSMIYCGPMNFTARFNIDTESISIFDEATSVTLFNSDTGAELGSATVHIAENNEYIVELGSDSSVYTPGMEIIAEVPIPANTSIR